MLATLPARSRRRLSPAVTAAITLSAAAHVGLFAYLYYQRFELPPPPPEKPVFIWKGQLLPPPRPPPPPEKPILDDRPPPPPTGRQARVRESLPPVTPTDSVTLVPYDGPEVVSDGPVTLAPVDPGPPTPPADPAPPAPPQNPPGPPVITRPNWLSRPTGEQMARYYPSRALEREVSGRAVLQCRVTASGQVADCRVAGETPANAGFGEAALKLARYFRMSPQTEDGQPVEGGSVRVPLVFKLD